VIPGDCRPASIYKQEFVTGRYARNGMKCE